MRTVAHWRRLTCGLSAVWNDPVPLGVPVDDRRPIVRRWNTPPTVRDPLELPDERTPSETSTRHGSNGGRTRRGPDRLLEHAGAGTGAGAGGPTVGRGGRHDDDRRRRALPQLHAGHRLAGIERPRPRPV